MGDAIKKPRSLNKHVQEPSGDRDPLGIMGYKNPDSLRGRGHRSGKGNYKNKRINHSHILLFVQTFELFVVNAMSVNKVM